MKQTEVDCELTNGAWAAAISPYLINDLPPDICMCLTHPVNFPCGRKHGVPGENPRLSAERWLFTLFTWVLGSSHIEKFSLRFEPAALEVKGKCANHLATEAPFCYTEDNQIIISIAVDDTDHVMKDVMLKREAATEFFQRDRRDLNHECYAECCSWEEVREHYEHDIPAAVRLILL